MNNIINNSVNLMKIHFFSLFLNSICKNKFCRLFNIITKPLPILYLFIQTYINNFEIYNTKTTEYRLLISYGLFFSLLGDISLSFVLYNNLFFLTGVLLFMVSNTIYLYTIFNDTINTEFQFKFFIFFLTYGLNLLMILIPNINNKILKICISIYAMIMISLGYVSFLNKNNYLIYGTSIYIISDSILAINKFVTKIPFSDYLIMITYYTAQILICLSVY